MGRPCRGRRMRWLGKAGISAGFQSCRAAGVPLSPSAAWYAISTISRPVIDRSVSSVFFSVSSSAGDKSAG